ncbi:hypothetical protein FA15DRAFT_409358 [Coprinopsis marcescibilis]|uniref:Uncharacterized protein n=1 Tax=Coprinopsis marcescibilis TaxID=230819 RepID=A0A5C3KWN2_COPMA|nr:hypothetical protein FA15DRAFT_409358 [Coprinopsis marcescibilis]
MRNLCPLLPPEFWSMEVDLPLHPQNYLPASGKFEEQTVSIAVSTALSPFKSWLKTLWPAATGIYTSNLQTSAVGRHIDFYLSDSKDSPVEGRPPQFGANTRKLSNLPGNVSDLSRSAQVCEATTELHLSILRRVYTYMDDPDTSTGFLIAPPNLIAPVKAWRAHCPPPLQASMCSSRSQGQINRSKSRTKEHGRGGSKGCCLSSWRQKS